MSYKTLIAAIFGVLLTALAFFQSLPPVHEGRIVYDSNSSGTFGLYSMKFNGKDVKRIFDSEEHDAYPAVAPDGSYIAFLKSKESARDVLGQIWIVRPDGSDARMLTEEARYPIFSSDSKKVFYVWKHKVIISIDLETGGKQIIFPNATTPKEFLPARTLNYLNASPDGKKLAFVSYIHRGWYSLFINLETGKVEKIVHGCQPVWGPESKSIIYMTEHHDTKDQRRIMRYHLETKEQEIILDNPPPWGYEYFPSLTSDGKYLLFSESRFDKRDFYGSNFQIFIQNLETKKQQGFKITHTLIAGCNICRLQKLLMLKVL